MESVGKGLKTLVEDLKIQKGGRERLWCNIDYGSWFSFTAMSRYNVHNHKQYYCVFQSLKQSEFYPCSLIASKPPKELHLYCIPLNMP